MKRVYLDNIGLLENIVREDQEEMTYTKFLNSIKKFLGNLLNDPINAKPSIDLLVKGLYKSKLINLLSNQGVLTWEKKDDTDENGNSLFVIKYKVPRNNFERKIKKLYIKIFEKNVPEAISTETNVDECGGATTAAAVNNVAPIVPLGQSVKKKPLYYFTESQVKMIEETTSTFTVGAYQYDVPFSFKRPDGKKDDAYIHNKKGGICCDQT